MDLAPPMPSAYGGRAPAISLGMRRVATRLYTSVNTPDAAAYARCAYGLYIWRGEDKKLCWLYESNTYKTFEDYTAMNLKVYFNDDSFGLARIFPTVGPATEDGDVLRVAARDN